MFKSVTIKRITALTAWLTLAAPGWAHDVNHQGRAPVQADPSQIPVRVIDRPVLDQDGASHVFGRDVVSDRIVVIDFIYTSCATLCPMQSAILADLQDKVGDRLGRDVALISISIDPVTDKPARLKAEADRFGAKPGWRFLTGLPNDIEVILTGMQAWVETPEDHPGFFLVGSARESHWRKLGSLSSPDQLLAAVAEATHAHVRHH